MIREIVHIDEAKCNGCGDCIPSCEEGAIRLVKGKAKLINDQLCDGLGACLGHCPQGAITIERREAEEFDEALVAQQKPQRPTSYTFPGILPQVRAEQPAAIRGGCPGSQMQQFRSPSQPPESTGAVEDAPSQLSHWPVQINLLPPNAPILRNARLLIAADCVPVAYADFHPKFLKERAVIIGCPKFDDLAGYVERFTAIMQYNDLEEIVVTRMEVPCCIGITQAVLEARRRANVPVVIVEAVIATDGKLLSEREIPIE